jgi:hypothetical protein
LSLARRDRIRVLAWSLLDYLYLPRTGTGVLTAGDRRAPSPDRWDVCPACGGDQIHDRYGRPLACDRCSGAGRVRVDGYTGDHVATLDAPAPPRLERSGCPWCQPLGHTTRRFDRLPRGNGVGRHGRCDPCDGTGWITSTRADDPAELALRGTVNDPVLAAIARRDQAGSWHDLDRALATVRLENQAGHRLFWVCHVTYDRIPDALTDHGKHQLGRAFSRVDGLMPARIRVPADIVTAWQRPPSPPVARFQRDREIRRLSAAGVPHHRVAEQLRVHESTVRRVMYGRATVAA